MNRMVVGCFPPAQFSDLLPVEEAILNEMPKNITFSKISRQPKLKVAMYFGVVSKGI